MSDYSQDQTNQSAGGDNAQAANPKKLFIGNLSWGLTSEDLQQLFAEFGTVEEAFVLTDKFSGRSKGFGFVTMSTAEEAQAAIEGLHQREVDGRQIAVNVAQPPRPRQEWGGGGDRRGGGGGGRRFDDRRQGGGGGNFRRGR
jgi:cold-inducible RNA-binding protein